MPCANSALIIGGGIAGLSSAIALARVGVRCEVIEKGNSKEGASIGISGRAADAMEELGLYDQLYKSGTPIPHDSGIVSIRNPAGDIISPGPRRPNGPGIKQTVTVYRPTLIDILTNAATELGVHITRGVTFSKIDNRIDGVDVTLTNGEERKVDLLVGADGIASATRKSLFPNAPEPTYSGQFSVRWMAPGPRVEPESWYVSPIGRLGFYYLPENVVYVPAVFNVPEHQRLCQEDVFKLFTKLLDSMTAPATVELRRRLKPDSELIGRPFKWILLPDPWYRHRAVLIGDAAHATTAHMGQGGCMALEDSVVLAQCVRDAETVEQAFEKFMKRRFERVATVVTSSVKLSELEQKGARPEENRELLSKALAAISAPY